MQLFEMINSSVFGESNQNNTSGSAAVFIAYQPKVSFMFSNLSLMFGTCSTEIKLSVGTDVSLLAAFSFCFSACETKDRK